MPELEPGEAAQDYYRVLGLPEQASDTEIRQHYYALAKQWHPDHFTRASEGQRALAERRMKQINRAYHILGSASLRQQYDDLRHARLAQDEHGHHWRPVPGMQPISTVPPGFAAPWPSPLDRGNPNGFGFLGALLSFMLALALLWNVSNNLTTGLLLIAGAIFFGVTGILFLQPNSFLTRGVNSWLNSEPQNFRQMRAQADQAQLKRTRRVVRARTEDAFLLLVEDAVDSLPAEFQARMENVAVFVEDAPGPELLKRLDIPEGATLLGLYQGVPITQQRFRGRSGTAGSTLPERITIYQRTIEDYCHHDPDLIREQVTSTVLHEVAHHFGLDHEEMPIWVK
jgi:predicted Zn-dependent protease with MMP-like domain